MKNYLRNPRIKNYLILIGILIPSAQTLFFIHLYGINAPFWDEWDFVPTINSFLNGDPLWVTQIFAQHNEHRLFFPGLIFLSNVIFTSWNLVAQMYLSWIILGAILVFFYLFLRRTGTNFTWLIIPIALILYSPDQWENFLWGFQIQWFLVLASFLWSLYFLNNSTKFSIIPSTALAIISSFSLVAGLLSWPIGLLTIINKKENKKWKLAIWLTSATIVYFFYFHGYYQPQGHPIVSSFSALPQFFEYVLVYLSGPFYMPNYSLRIGMSIFIVLITISGMILYKKRNNEFSLALPWFQLSLFAFFTALMSSVGRLSFGIDQSLSSRYITISNLFEISGLVFLCMIFIITKEGVKRNGHRKLIYLIFLCIIFLGIISTSANYVAGWIGGRNHFEWITYNLTCLNIPLHPFDGCQVLFPNIDTLYAASNTLVWYKLSYFSQLHLDPAIDGDPLLDMQNWLTMKKSHNGYGNIDTVNGVVLSSEKVYVNSSLVTINGWILDENKKTVNNVYFFVDGKPFLKLDKFEHFKGVKGDSPEDQYEGAMKDLWDHRKDLQAAFPEVQNNNYANLQSWIQSHPSPLFTEYLGNFTPRPDVVKALGNGTDLDSGWSFSFFSAYFGKGCHNISVRSANGTFYNEILSKSEICIKYK